MKKLLLVGALALFGAMNAQTEKGSWVIAGSTTLGFNNVTLKAKANGNTVDGPKTSSFNVTPSVGYFVANKIAVGLDLGFTSTTEKGTTYVSTSEYDYKSTSSTMYVMPTLAYYFKSDSKLIPFLGAGVGYFSNTSKHSFSNTSSFDSKTTVDGLVWGAKGGVVYMITPAIGVDAGVSYLNMSHKEDDVKYLTNTFGVNVGFSFFFK